MLFYFAQVSHTAIELIKTARPNHQSGQEQAAGAARLTCAAPH